MCKDFECQNADRFNVGHISIGGGMFPEVLKVTVVKNELGKPIEIRLSIRTIDTKVEVYVFTPQEFAIMVAKYQAQLED